MTTRVGSLRRHLCRHLEPGHHRHLDVGEEDVRAQSLDQLAGFAAIRARPMTSMSLSVSSNAASAPSTID
jgi:hypothetical protein